MFILCNSHNTIAVNSLQSTNKTNEHWRHQNVVQNEQWAILVFFGQMCIRKSILKLYVHAIRVWNMTNCFVSKLTDPNIRKSYLTTKTKLNFGKPRIIKWLRQKQFKITFLSLVQHTGLIQVFCPLNLYINFFLWYILKSQLNIPGMFNNYPRKAN